VHLTTAPIPLAVPIAYNPATPVPITNTLVGAALPKAVIIYLENFGNS